MFEMNITQLFLTERYWRDKANPYGGNEFHAACHQLFSDYEIQENRSSKSQDAIADYETCKEFLLQANEGMAIAFQQEYRKWKSENKGEM